jgi:flagellar basal-body rod modification protein FlgD
MSASIMPASVTPLTQGTQLPSAAATQQSTPAGMLSQNDFLTLLTTQLEHQDPLNPQSPSDFAAELAQFSTASGIQTLNTTLTSTSGLQAASLVGRNVAVPGNQLLLGSSGGAPGSFNLSGQASDVVVAVVNSSGGIVATMDLGPLAAGTQSFNWNGQDSAGKPQPPGAYSYTVTAIPAAGATTVATPYAVAPVGSVVLGGVSGPVVNLGGGLAPVALSSVAQVF